MFIKYQSYKFFGLISRTIMPVEDPRLRLRRAAREGNLDLIKRLLAKTNMQNPDPKNGWYEIIHLLFFIERRILINLLKGRP